MIWWLTVTSTLRYGGISDYWLLNAEQEFLAHNCHIRRGADADFDALAFNSQHRDLNGTGEDNAFANFPS